MTRPSTRRDFLRTVAAAAAVPLAKGAFAAGRASAARKPNILILIADDCTYTNLGCYGGTNVATPRIDRLARQGMQFTHGYVAMSMCCPCRHELYTGLYPVRNGAAWNHSFAKPGTRSIVHHLGKLGYRVGLTGKTHIGPRSSFPFVDVPGFERNCVSQTAKYEMSGIRRFMTAKPDQPWCLAIAMVLSHVPWTVGDPTQFDKAKLTLPPTFPDLPEVREDYTKYLAEVAALDKQVGDILDLLTTLKLADDTLVLFTSEQGAQWPGAKWTCWEQGMHTAFMVRWPGRVKPGTKTSALVQYADVVPTLIEIAGGDPAAAGLDGASFLPVLTGRRTTHRTYVYGLHNNVPEGPPYPIRTIRTKEYRYIRNLTPRSEYIEKHMEQPKRWGGHWEAWKKAAAAGHPRAKALFQRYRHRPAEELYRTEEDPFELKNLADDPKYAKVKARLRAELDRWMQAQRDPGAAMDTPEALQANRKAARAENQRTRPPAPKKPKPRRKGT